jgi:dihydroorotate dehydrogenase electron transfer subunit
LIPLGNAWPIPGGDQIGFKKAIVVAGGIGAASVLMLCSELKSLHIDSTIFFGAASESVARGCGLEDLRQTRLPIILTTDDGSLGEHGLITHPFGRMLRNLNGPEAVVYTCGPWAMMKRVAEIAAACGTSCYASLEAPMACGFGVCVGCVVAVNDDRPHGYHSYRRVCVDGSIFQSDMIRWDVNAMAH